MKYQQMNICTYKGTPDTYVGLSIKEEKEMYIYRDEIIKESVSWVPAVYKYLMR